MFFETDYIYHIYNRGNNNGLIFFNQDNYKYFLHKVKEEICPVTEILAYCLMPNHFHFLVQATEASCGSYQPRSGKTILMQALVKKIALVLSSYTRAINKQENRYGGLFSPKTKAKSLNLLQNKNDYLSACFFYIHQNPYIAGLVDKIEHWEFSSFNEYLNNKDYLCNIELGRELLNLNEDFYQVSYMQVDEQIFSE